MQVKQVMDQKVARIGVSTTFQEAAELLVLTRASDLIVVDAEGAFLGVVSEGDVLRALIPDYGEVTAAGGSMHDAARMFVDQGRDLATQTIERLIIRHPITVTPDDDLLAVSAIMIDKMIRRLPVVDGRRFVGTIARADVAWAVLSLNTGKR
ncbi:MAG: CBS domain-containing protein [Vicinamibacterales bacterium]